MSGVSDYDDANSKFCSYVICGKISVFYTFWHQIARQSKKNRVGCHTFALKRQQNSTENNWTLKLFKIAL